MWNRPYIPVYVNVFVNSELKDINPSECERERMVYVNQVQISYISELFK